MTAKEKNKFEFGIGGLLAVSVIYVVFGLLMLLIPSAKEVYVIYVISIVLIAFGIFMIARYFFNAQYKEFGKYGFSGGVLAVIAGCCLLIRAGEVSGYFSLFIGGCILVSAIIKLQNAVALGSMKHPYWLFFLILALVFLSASFPTVTSVLIAISKAAEIATGGAVKYQYILLITGIIIIIYVIIGGMKSIVMTDTIQGLIYIGILWAIVIACLIIGFHGSLANAVQTVWQNSNDWFSYPGPNELVPYSARFGYPFCCAIGWTIMLPHVFIRSGYAGASLQTQRKLMFLTPVLQVIVWSGCMLIGLVAIGMMPGLDTAQTEYIIPYLIQNFIQNLHPAVAVILMIGFFVGAVSVGVTTADSFLLVSGSILTEDILVHTFRLKLTDRHRLLAVRIVIALIGVCSICMALRPPGLIFTLIMFANAIVMPLFPILVIGIYWKKATKQAAVIASIVGTALVLMTYFLWDLGDAWYGTFGLIGSTCCMILISLFTKQPESDSQEFYQALQKGEEEYFENTPEWE